MSPPCKSISGCVARRSLVFRNCTRPFGIAGEIYTVPGRSWRRHEPTLPRKVSAADDDEGVSPGSSCLGLQPDPPAALSLTPADFAGGFFQHFQFAVDTCEFGRLRGRSNGLPQCSTASSTPVNGHQTMSYAGGESFRSPSPLRTAINCWLHQLEQHVVDTRGASRAVHGFRPQASYHLIAEMRRARRRASPRERHFAALVVADQRRLALLAGGAVRYSSGQNDSSPPKRNYLPRSSKSETAAGPRNCKMALYGSSPLDGRHSPTGTTWEDRPSDDTGHQRALRSALWRWALDDVEEGGAYRRRRTSKQCDGRLKYQLSFVESGSSAWCPRHWLRQRSGRSSPRRYSRSTGG